MRARWVRVVVAAAVAVGLSIGQTDAAAAEHWPWPVPAPVHVTAAYQAPPSAYAAGHRGIDLAAAEGTEVTSPVAGVVTFAGVVVDRPLITVQTSAGVLVSFEPVASDLDKGDPVAAGQLLGHVAAGGHCDGDCVHVGVRVNGAYVNPLLYFSGVPPAVLLPLG
ncbi:murein hydrolase activator EnvC family protein [Gryllotalpicola ginsengisoli]|uniref:murein hydrolase activator EnvC family protein n=1 Tax=Gryllotalpicola ginsengisoli TaxID=444608 RepID=UPI00048735E5|nr:M23 family metallopeptidase [Gryllotalpicola ginsengisoli]